MLYSEIIAVCSQIHTKHINTLVVMLNKMAPFCSATSWPNSMVGNAADQLMCRGGHCPGSPGLLTSFNEEEDWRWVSQRCVCCVTGSGGGGGGVPDIKPRSWALRCCGMWRCVVGPVVSDVSKPLRDFVWKHCDLSKRLNELTQLYSLFAQKNLVTAWGAESHGTPSSKENVIYVRHLVMVLHWLTNRRKLRTKFAFWGWGGLLQSSVWPVSGHPCTHHHIAEGVNPQ
jgi:hypothetical protein